MHKIKVVYMHCTVRCAAWCYVRAKKQLTRSKRSDTAHLRCIERLYHTKAKSVHLLLDARLVPASRPARNSDADLERMPVLCANDGMYRRDGLLLQCCDQQVYSGTSPTPGPSSMHCTIRHARYDSIVTQRVDMKDHQIAPCLETQSRISAHNTFVFDVHVNSGFCPALIAK